MALKVLIILLSLFVSGLLVGNELAVFILCFTRFPTKRTFGLPSR
jgi:hypothetical protein